MATPTPVVVALLLSLALGAAGHATGLKSELTLQGATDLRHDEAHEDRWDGRSQIDLTAEGTCAEPWQWKTAGRIQGDSFGDGGFFGRGETRNEVDVDLREAYLRYENDRFAVQAGNQIVKWGKMDELVITDNVNPQDLDQFIIPWLDDRKLAVPMVAAEAYFGPTTVELLLLPRPFIHRVPFFDSDWALFRHNRQVGADATSSYPDVAARYLDLGVNVNAPGWGDSEIGGRLRSTAGTVDFAIDGFVYHQRFPVFHGDGPTLAALFAPEATGAALTSPTIGGVVRNRFLNANPEATASYPWVATLGGEVETTLGDYGVRAEVARTLGGQYQGEAPDGTVTVFTADQTLLGVGGDLTRNAFYGNLQLVQQWVEEAGSLLFVGKQAATVVATLQYDLLAGTLTPALYAAWDLGDNASYLRPRLEYKVNDRLTVEAGLELFTGNKHTALGSFTANDQGYVLATLGF
ncbi:MAG: hypothetical protein COW73_06075 [Nitrospirae bacterium CG18_big_fil_WC_8_21_14_2_50_70_55]|nr:hypothetical protein [Deltaproteobacteria bacterium]OIP62375.1 MAG: hypothetical protein AUK30_10285 [Nitrospirae bacterium CG2_30_70_394]PIQ05343.1 MAG: hypothetical protein COW73_06075 [Nitrospirae bacterium CG18_big_fil_WC_8_21_14_2_50_70_55]PIU78815.1 MAG: hypothetical protein COS73_06190 [Nitrospirae bacterium CG06_land_8_20_14_3_00_70_43]PIW81806.1 MAG: hypothetical protein COZ96_11945 [Nitrospirae bacterium CG_4_8_14_3_um_filter_70_85]PIX83835.1 MAG: hypothetical protein COZ33_03355 